MQDVFRFVCVIKRHPLLSIFQIYKEKISNLHVGKYANYQLPGCGHH